MNPDNQENETKSLDNLNYTISNSVYNLSNSVVNFMQTSSANYSCNISSKMNDAIVLSESFFMIEYVYKAGINGSALISNWFLSMLNSMNFNINSYSFQLNSIAPERTFPMLVQTLRYLQYEQSDFSKYSKLQHEYYQTFLNSSKHLQLDAGRPTVYNTLVDKEGASQRSYLVLNLKDLLPVIDTINQCTGLLSFSFVLNYNKNVHSLVGKIAEPKEFSIMKINFHYPVKTYNNEQVIDIDINYFKTLGILQGKNPEYSTILPITLANYRQNVDGTISPGTVPVPVTVSNIQLSTNQIFKLLIFPVFSLATIPEGAAGAVYDDNILKYSQDGQFELVKVLPPYSTMGIDNFKSGTADGNNYKNSIDYLLTPTGSIGSPLFGITNLKVVVNGNTISPSNITPNYISPYNADYYQYFYGFDQSPINRYSKPNLFFSYDMYQNFSPIIVDISNATSKNAYNSLTFSYSVYNKFLVPNESKINIPIKLETFYTVLNLQVLND